jgi:hypothetical protein
MRNRLKQVLITPRNYLRIAARIVPQRVNARRFGSASSLATTPLPRRTTKLGISSSAMRPNAQRFALARDAQREAGGPRRLARLQPTAAGCIIASERPCSQWASRAWRRVTLRAESGSLHWRDFVPWSGTLGGKLVHLRVHRQHPAWRRSLCRGRSCAAER